MLISKYVSRFLIATATAFSFASVAFAQSTILVIDQNRVLRESEVGKHITRQVESIGKSMEAEMKASITPLADQEKKLNAELQNQLKQKNPDGSKSSAEMQQVAAQVLKSRPDIMKRIQDLKVKGEKQKVEAAYKQRELQITEQKAVKKVNEKVATILEAIVAERNADIIVDRSLVIYGGKDADITQVVLDKLNAEMRTVSVVRERLPRKPVGQAPLK